MRNHNIKNKIQDLKILIVGDIMLDIFRYGNISRMSQEAPVPVLDIDREYFHPGGALNVCRNVRSLGADCRIISLTGQDSERNTILDLCRKYDIPVKNLFSDPSRPTTVKSRVYRDNRQIYRIDRESRQPISLNIEKSFKESIDTTVNDCDAIILQDYNKGCLTGNIIRHIIEKAKESGIKVFVDPKTDNIDFYRQAYLIKPNRKEASHLSGMNIRTFSDAGIAAGRLYKRLDCLNCIITLGEDGCIHHNGNSIRHYPVKKLDTVDVTGAGDTVISVLSVLKSAGFPLDECIRYANRAGKIVCSRPGVAAVEFSDLF